MRGGKTLLAALGPALALALGGAGDALAQAVTLDSGDTAMTKRVGVALRGQRGNGRVQSTQGPGQYMLWEIAR